VPDAKYGAVHADQSPCTQPVLDLRARYAGELQLSARNDSMCTRGQRTDHLIGFPVL
jgi:hypothetical protein